MGPLDDDPLVPPPDAPAMHSHGPWLAWTFHWQVKPPRDALVVIVKATYRIVPGGACVPTEEPDPPSGDVRLGDKEGGELVYSTDFAIRKPKADVLLTGSAYARGDDRTVARVHLRLGRAVDRVITVLGDREWTAAGVRNPAPFESIPLAWERAFGGPDVDANPVGLGGDASESNPRGALPNLEDPAAMITAPGDRPRPACFAPVAPEWRARASKTGDFKGDWSRSRWPWLPDNFDYAFFNAAPPQQQVERLTGDEDFLLGGVHPELAALSGTLPDQRPRAYVERRPGAGGDFFEVRLALDTVHFLPNDLKVVLVWRGLVEVRDPWGSEIAGIHVLPVAHAESLSLDDARQRAIDARITPPEPDETAPDDPAADPRVALAAAGALGVPMLAEPEAPTAPRVTRDEVLAMLARGEPLSGRDLSHVDLSHLDLRGHDLSGAVCTDASFAGCVLDGADLTECELSGVDLHNASLKGARLERADLTGSRLGGADFTGATLTDATLAKSFAAKAIFAGASAAGVDFAGAVLREANFNGALLTAADFTLGTLEDATFVEATLDDARIHESWSARAVFDRASMKDFRAESADLRGARAANAKADGSLWQASRLDGAHFEGAALAGAIFSRAVLDGANLSRVVAGEANFRRALMRNTVLLRANLMKASLDHADLTGADLRGANLYEADLRGARTDGADWSLAIVTNTGLAPR